MALRIGNSNADGAYGIALDAAGNIHLAGYFRGTVDFDPGAGTANLTSVGASDIFILKLDAGGNYLWARNMGSNPTTGNWGNDIAVDAAGNVYTTGFFGGTVDFDPGAGIYNLTSAGSQDIFVQKLDASGNFLWAIGLSEPGADEAWGIRVDASGNIYVAGFFSGTIDFDPGAGTHNLTPLGSNDIFILKLDTDGNFIWAKNIGGSGSVTQTWSGDIDASGNVYVSGYFNAAIDCDPNAGTFTLTPVGGHDILVLKLDASGNFVWAKSMGGTGDDFGYGIAVDGYGNVFTTGSFTGTADFDPGAGISNLISSSGSDDIFIQRLDAGGNFVWATGLGNSGFDYGYCVAPSDAGYVYVAGGFMDVVDFDPGAGTANFTVSGGSVDVFVLKLAQPDILPLRLLSFTGWQQHEQVMLKWSTADEQNVSHFEAERSADGRTFTAIGRVQALNNVGGAGYHFTDEHPAGAVSWYRLKIVDIDGSHNYSGLIKMIGRGNGLEVYPIPATTVLNINSGAAQEAVMINAAGMVIQKIQLKKGNNIISIANRSPGTYFIKTGEGRVISWMKQ